MPTSPRRPRRARSLTIPVALAIAGLVALGACSGPGTDRAAETAVEFAGLVGQAPDRACALLSEQVRTELERTEKLPCADALAGLDLPPATPLESADVYEKHARVVLEDDVLFLAAFDDGWKVTAAGCTPQPDDAPYECELGG